MPDQSSAATEHAILQEITAPLADAARRSAALAADVDFPVALRGYDRIAVDAYVKQTSQLVAELQATRSPEAAVRRALERVGEQISGILQRAHETAEEITAQSRREAEDRLEQARREAGRDHGRGRAAAQGPRRRHRPDLGRAPADRRRRAGARAPAVGAGRARPPSGSRPPTRRREVRRRTRCSRPTAGRGRAAELERGRGRGRPRSSPTDEPGVRRAGARATSTTTPAAARAARR